MLSCFETWFSSLGKIGLQVLLKGVAMRRSRRMGVMTGFFVACALPQRRRVQYQGDLAVAEDGRAADPGKPLEQPAERLDHGLEFPEQRVDDEPGTVSGVVHDDDVLALAGIALYLEYVAQAQQGQHLPAQVDVAALADAQPVFRGELQALDHHLDRTHEGA